MTVVVGDKTRMKGSNPIYTRDSCHLRRGSFFPEEKAVLPGREKTQGEAKINANRKTQGLVMEMEVI